MTDRIMSKNLRGILEINDGVTVYGLPFRVLSRIDVAELENLYSLKFQCEGILEGELVSTDTAIMESMLDLADDTVLYLEKVVRDMDLAGKSCVIEVNGYLNDEIRDLAVTTTDDLCEELGLPFYDGEIDYVYDVANLEYDVASLSSMSKKVRRDL